MAGIGPMEIAIVAMIALIILGPKRLPAAGRSLGHGLREFKGAISGERSHDDHELPEVTEAVAPTAGAPAVAVRD